MSTKTDRIDVIREEIERKGLFTINKTALAKKLDVSRQTIHKDIHEIISNYELNSLKYSNVMINELYLDSMKKSHKLTKHPDEKISLNALELIRRYLDSYNSFLSKIDESMKNKEIQDKNIDINIVHTLQNIANINDEEWKEIENNRRKKING